jgi:hypothetical protein
MRIIIGLTAVLFSIHPDKNRDTRTDTNVFKKKEAFRFLRITFNFQIFTSFVSSCRKVVSVRVISFLRNCIENRTDSM